MTEPLDNQSDREDMLSAVRSAMETHSEPLADREVEPSEQPSEVEHHQREADQSSIDMGLQVAAQLNAEDRQRGEQSKLLRDGKGRFTSATAGVDEAAGAGQQVPLQEAPAGPPSSWSPAAKQEWQNLSPALRDAIAKREHEVSQGFSQYRDKTQSSAQIESMLAPRRQAFQQHGLKSDAEAIEKLLLVSDGMAANPSGTLAFLAQQFGVGAEQIFGQPQFSQESFNSAVQQQATQLARQWIAQYQVQEFEKKAPADYSQVRPLMAAAVTNGLAHDPWSAYQVVTAPARRAAKSAAKVNRKMAAANASLSGAPHGTSASPARSNGAQGKFADYAEDVRAAMASLS